MAGSREEAIDSPLDAPMSILVTGCCWTLLLIIAAVWAVAKIGGDECHRTMHRSLTHSDSALVLSSQIAPHLTCAAFFPAVTP